jgi:hypothetical protein
MSPATAFSSPDPRHDHKGVRLVCLFPGIEPMPPLESLFRPLLLKMKGWSHTRQEWQASTTQALAAVDEGSIDCFVQLEQMKQVAVVLEQRKKLEHELQNKHKLVKIRIY